jgi:hypothetical protein
LPFSAVAQPLQQQPSGFISTAGFCWGWQPFAPVVDAGWNQALHAVLPVTADPYHELINYAMPVGVADMVIPLAVEKVSPVLLLSGPMISNFVDASPLTGLSFTVINMSTSLLVIQLNALLDSSNYRFQALVTVVG